MIRKINFPIDNLYPNLTTMLVALNPLDKTISITANNKKSKNASTFTCMKKTSPRLLQSTTIPISPAHPPPPPITSTLNSPPTISGHMTSFSKLHVPHMTSQHLPNCTFIAIEDLLVNIKISEGTHIFQTLRVGNSRVLLESLKIVEWLNTPNKKL